MFKMAVWCALVFFVPPPQEQTEKQQAKKQQGPDGPQQASTEKKYETDTYKTAKGDLAVTCIGHGTLMFRFDGKVVHVDPVSRYADYGKMPKADLILITHEHGDHLDIKTIEKISTENTELILTKTCFEKIKKGKVMKNGEKRVAKVDIAFLPMNLPYTMTPEMVADAARAMMPKVLYPYHFGKTDTSKLVTLLKEHKEIQVKIRKLQ